MPVMWAIFVDDLHLDFRNTGRLRDLMRRVSGELIRDGDVFAMSASGPSQLSVPFTTDRSIIPTAIRKVTGNGLRPRDFLGDIDSPRALDEVRYRAGIALAAARRLLTELTQTRDAKPRTRQKAFVYVSNGYYFDVPAGNVDSPGATRHPNSVSYVSPTELRERASSFTRLARQARVKVFVIDARMAAPPDLEWVDAEWERYWATTQRSLLTLSAGTGGSTLLDREALATGLTRISDTMRRSF